MFPSSGYFRGVSCPFYASGLCERPYCHFRHSRTEAERTTKTETGPSYSTSNVVQSSSLLSVGKSPSTQSLSTDHAQGLVSYSTSAPVLPQGPVEAYVSLGSNNDASDASSCAVSSIVSDSLSIPSFSSAAPSLPESDNELPISAESLPKISGLPKSRKTLPSYVPTPKTFAKPVVSGCVPSYTPTPKSGNDAIGHQSSHVIEYDPLKNFTVSDHSTGPDEEEAAFSDENDDALSDTDTHKANGAACVTDDNGLTTNNNRGDKQMTNGITTSSTAADDLTDSDEEVSYHTDAAESSNIRKDPTDFADLLTPSSFFREKSTLSPSSSCSKKVGVNGSAKTSSKHSSLSCDKEQSNQSSSKSTSSSEKFHKSRTLQRSSSAKSDTSSSQSKSRNLELSNSAAKINTSSSHKKSSSSTHKSSLSSKKDKSNEKESSSSSSSGKQSKSSSSSSNKDSKNDHKSSSYSSSSSKKHTSSSSHKPSSSRSGSDGHSKDSENFSKERTKEKSPATPSISTSEKPHGSSSEKENRHSSSRPSSHKSVSRSSSSSSSSSKTPNDNHKSSRSELKKSSDKTIKTEMLEAGKANIKTSVTSKDSSKHKETSLKPSEINNVKLEKKMKELESSSSSSKSSTKSNNKSTMKKEIKGSHSGSDKRKEGISSKSHKSSSSITKSSKVSGDIADGSDFDSDIEIIEPPPAPVYNISDSDDNNDDGDTQQREEEEEDSSETEFSMDNVDLLSDADTFDECLRIFQESERQLAKKSKKTNQESCPDKRKSHDEPEAFESSENLLATLGKKRMAYANSAKISRPQKAPASSRPRLSPAQVMHNRIIEMQKRALLRAAKREGREADLPQMSSPTKTPLSGGISLMGGGLPAAASSSSSLRSNNSISSNIDASPSVSSSGVHLSPSILPPTGQKQRQAHIPSTSFFPGSKTPPRKPAPSGSSGSGGLTMSPNSFYNKKKPALSSSASSSKTVTVAGTASKTEKRKAHEPTLSNLKRPLIPAEFGGKVPTNVRQRYLNLIIDEHLKFRPEEEAYTKGEEDEKAVYEKSTNRNIYLRVAVNTIKRIRTDAAQSVPSTSKRPCPEGAVTGSIVNGGHMAQSHAATLGGRNAARHSYTLNRSRSGVGMAPAKIEGKDFYERLRKYILSESQLRENGFPRPAEDGSSKVQFYKEEVSDVLLKENERVCRRCGKRFNVTKDGEPINNGLCVYHYGGAFKKKVSGSIETRYGCCNERAGEKGCQVAPCHVHERNKLDNRSGYMRTMPASSTDKDYKVYSLDCEMVYTKAGFELARVTVVGEKCEVVYETLVKPDTDIIDYNTRFSGITAADMKGVTTTIRGVQAVMLSMVSDKTILMGHSLESDLVALKLTHSTVVDTSIVFPHRLGLPYKRALRNLMLDHLKKIIQADDGGHDSQEDAAACMQLMMFKVKEDAKKEYRRN